MINCQGQCGDVSFQREQVEQRPACSKGVKVPAEVSLAVKMVCPLRKSFCFIFSEMKEGDEDWMDEQTHMKY